MQLAHASGAPGATQRSIPRKSPRDSHPRSTRPNPPEPCDPPPARQRVAPQSARTSGNARAPAPAQPPAGEYPPRAQALASSAPPSAYKPTHFQTAASQECTTSANPAAAGQVAPARLPPGSAWHKFGRKLAPQGAAEEAQQSAGEWLPAGSHPPPPSSPLALCLLGQPGQLNPKRLRNSRRDIQRGIAHPALDHAHVCGVQPSALRQLLLRNARRRPPGTDRYSEAL